jgi:eukaryotic-like serine/threonine-protein kinase
MPPPQKPIKEIFGEALEKASPEERAAYLNAACSHDPELRQQIDALLQAHAQCLEANDFLQQNMVTSAAIGEGPGSIIGRYKILQQIGEGGFGVVFMAEQQQPVRRMVALKVIKAGMDTREVVARFEAERQALALMDHPNIARVLDGGATDSGRPYFVMDLVKGVPITEFCDNRRLSTEARLRLFLQVCTAVQHAHQKGIIHRDLKPANILVTLHGGEPVPKVIDFGISKAIGQRLTEKTLFTRYEQLMGTPSYMSPEQAEWSGLDIDTRSDIYSLGVLLYELLTGTTPLEKETLSRAALDEIRRLVREQEPERPSARLSRVTDKFNSKSIRKLPSSFPSFPFVKKSAFPNPQSAIDTDLDWVVMKALEKDRTRRYETINALVSDLESHLRSEPVKACPPSATYRTRKFIQRHRVAVAVASSLALSLIGGITVSTWMFLKERTAHNRAVAAEHQQSRLRQEAQLAQATEAKLRKEARVRAYASDIKLAQIALAEDDLSRTWDLLKRYLPKPGVEDLRGIEWRYLWQASRNDDLYSFPHPGIVSCAAISPDKTLLATGCHDKLVRIWNLQTKELVTQFEGLDCDEPCKYVSFSPDGAFLACGNRGGVDLHETTRWNIARRLEGGAWPVLFSPDGKYLAATSPGGVNIWQTGSWTNFFLPTGMDLNSRSSLVFSAEGKLAVAANQKKLQLWNVQTRSKIGEFQTPSEVVTLALSLDGSRLAAGQLWGDLCVWNTEPREQIAKTKAHRSHIFALAFSPDARNLLTGSEDHLIHRWKIEGTTPNLEKIQTFKGHENGVWSLYLSDDGTLLASAGKDATAKVWRMTDQVEPMSAGWTMTNDTLLGFSLDGRGLLTLAPGPSIELLGVSDGKLLRSWPVDLRQKSDAAPVFIDATTFVIGTTNGRVRIADLENRQPPRTFQVGESSISALAISADGRLLFTVERPEKKAALWDLKSGKQLAKFDDFDLRANGNGAIAFSPDNRWLAYGTTKYELDLWDISRLYRVKSLSGHKRQITSVRFSPDSLLVATGGADHEARLWNIATGKELVPPLKAHVGGFYYIAFSPDQRTVITAGPHEIKLWNAANGSEMLSFDDLDVDPGVGLISPDSATLAFRTPGRWLHVIPVPTIEENQRAKRDRR